MKDLTYREAVAERANERVGPIQSEYDKWHAFIMQAEENLDDSASLEVLMEMIAEELHWNHKRMFGVYMPEFEE